MAEALNLQINIGGNAFKNLGEVKKALKEARAELIAAQTTFGEYSNEAVAAAKKVALFKDAIQEASETADLFDPGKKFQALSGALTAVAGGFTAVQGAIGLFGVESKEVEKQLLKVQSALALSQGLSTITDSAKDFQRLGAIIKTQVVTSFNTLKTAIGATGIGALAIALTLVIGYFEDIKKVITNLFPAFEKLTKFVGGIVERFTDFIGVTSQAERNLAALEKQTKRGNEEIENRIKILSAQGGKEKEIYELSKKLGEDEIAFLREKLKIKGKLSDEELKQFRDLKIQQELLDIQEQNRIKKAAEEKVKTNKEAQDKEKERLKKLRDDEQESIRRASALDLQSIQNRSKAAEETRKKEDEDVEALFAQEEKRQEKRIENSNKRILDDKKEKEALIEAEYQLADAKFQAASAGLSLLGTLVSKNEKLQNALFVADRALAIAKVIIDTQREIAGYAAANSPLGVPGLAITAKMALAAKIRAAASIATIAATTIAKFKGGGTNAGSNFGPSIPTLGAQSPIQPQASLTQLNQQMINAIGNQAIRAYVVETDITTNQKRIEAIKNKAKFG